MSVREARCAGSRIGRHTVRLAAHVAASRRVWLTGLFILPIGPDAQGIADALVAKGAMPAAAFADALHIGIAASLRLR